MLCDGVCHQDAIDLPLSGATLNNTILR